jgi:hypothetical protein
MKGTAVWEMLLTFFAPLTPTMEAIKPYHPWVSIFLVSVIAYFLIKGHRRHELLSLETEALVRRYMIFRGKRYGSLGKIHVQKGTSKKVLKSVSRSWHKFKEYYVERRRLLERNHRLMKRGFITAGILLILNTLWEGIAGLVITKVPSGLAAGVMESLPAYPILIVGWFLLKSQGEVVTGAPPQQIDPALEAVFATFDVEDPHLAEEFDPLEEDGEGKGEGEGE